MLYTVVLTFESVDEILRCDDSNESHWAVLSCGAVYYAVQGGSNFWVCGWNPKVWSFKWKLLSSTFPWSCLLCRIRWFQISSLRSLWMQLREPDWQLKASEQYRVLARYCFLRSKRVIQSKLSLSYWATLACDTVYYASRLVDNLEREHSSKSYWAVLSCVAIHSHSNRHTSTWKWANDLCICCKVVARRNGYRLTAQQND